MNVSFNKAKTTFVLFLSLALKARTVLDSFRHKFVGWINKSMTVLMLSKAPKSEQRSYTS